MRTFAWVLVLAGLLDGCTTNTPQQDYIYDMARPCEGKGIRLDYVSPDGQQWRGLAVHPSSSMPEFAQCLRENATRTPFEKWKRDNNVNLDLRDRPVERVRDAAAAGAGLTADWWAPAISEPRASPAWRPAPG